MLIFVSKRRVGRQWKYRYTCKQLVDGRCSIYKHRPQMCSQFGVKYPVMGYPDCIYRPENRPHS